MGAPRLRSHLLDRVFSGLQLPKVVPPTLRVAKTLPDPKNAAQRIYFPLLEARIEHGGPRRFRGGTKPKLHRNITEDDDGVRLTRGERKRRARATANALVSEARPWVHHHARHRLLSATLSAVL